MASSQAFLRHREIARGGSTRCAHVEWRSVAHAGCVALRTEPAQEVARGLGAHSDERLPQGRGFRRLLLREELHTSPLRSLGCSKFPEEGHSVRSRAALPNLVNTSSPVFPGEQSVATHAALRRYSESGLSNCGRRWLPERKPRRRAPILLLRRRNAV